MKVEVRCRACGRGHLLDSGKASLDPASALCEGCGAELVLPPSLRPAAAAKETEAPPPELPRPVNPAIRVAPPNLPQLPGSENIVCPRCGLHFQPGAVDASGQSGERSKVLIVEDMAYFQEMARDALAPKYDLTLARTVAEAREVLGTTRVDIILLDLVLSGGEDGLALLRGLAQKTCPILLFTAQDESDLYGGRWEELRALGVDDIVFKGMNTGENLARKVDELLAPLELGGE